jgi:hypothetical protein
LIEQAIPAAPVRTGSKAPTLAADDLGAIFDIEIDDAPAATPPSVATKNIKAPKKPVAKKSVKKISQVKKTPAVKQKKVKRVPK